MKHLTTRQLAFVEHYVDHGPMSASEAAKRAGYVDHVHEGAELLRHPAIAELIEEKRGAMRQAERWGESEVLARLEGLAIGGNPDSVRIQALELIGRNLGMWAKGDGPRAGDTFVFAGHMPEAERVQLALEALQRPRQLLDAAFAESTDQ